MVTYSYGQNSYYLSISFSRELGHYFFVCIQNRIGDKYLEKQLKFGVTKKAILYFEKK